LKKIKLMIFFLIYLTLTCSSYDTTIKIKSLKAVYEQLILEVPVLRFIESKEGLGYSYIFEILSYKLKSSQNDIKDLMNSPIIFYSDKNHSYQKFLNPNYINLLSEMILEFDEIVIKNDNTEILLKLIENIFSVEKNGETNFKIEGRNFEILEENDIIFLNKIKSEPSFDFDDNEIIKGQVKGLFEEEKWNFYITQENRTLKGIFETPNNMFETFSIFDIKNFSQNRYFGDLLEFQRITKNNFLEYIRRFLHPFDEISDIFITELTDSIERDSFVLITSQDLIKIKERSYYVYAAINLNELRRISQERNLETGRIGTYNYFKLTHNNYGDDVYIYVASNNFILSTIAPRSMNIYLSETPRLTDLVHYKHMDKKENLKKVVMIDLEEFFAKKYYSSVFSTLTVEFYEQKTGGTKMILNIR